MSLHTTLIAAVLAFAGVTAHASPQAVVTLPRVTITGKASQEVAQLPRVVITGVAQRQVAQLPRVVVVGFSQASLANRSLAAADRSVAKRG